MKLKRRHFLAGGAAALGGSALSSVVRPWRSVASAEEGQPRRFVFIVSGNGYDANITMSPAVRDWVAESLGENFNNDKWWGTGYDRAHYAIEQTQTHEIENGLSGAPGLRRFEALGLLDRCAMVYGLSSMVTGGGHGTSHGVLSSTRTLSSKPGGETIDHLLAQQECIRGIGAARTPLSAIRVGVTSSNNPGIGYGLCASGPGVSAPVLYSPQATWNAYVRPFVDPEGSASLDYRKRLIEVSQRDAQRALQQLPTNQQAAAMLEAANGQLMDLELFRATLNTNFGRLSAPPEMPGEITDPFQYNAFQTSVVASALEAELTRVAVLSFGAGAGAWTWSYGLGQATTGTLHDSDSIHSFSGDGIADGGTHTRESIRTEMREVWSRELDNVADLAAHLDSVPEPDGDGSMLDNTIITFLPGNGVGHHASARDFPTLVIGGNALGIRTGGRALIYPEFNGGTEGRRELVNLWNTYGVSIADAANEAGSLVGFGDKGSRLAEGVLPELLS